MPPPKTHFLCLPLATPQSRPLLQPSLAHFHTTLQARPDFANLDPRIFRPLGTLHLTLGVMNLATPERLASLTAFFRALDVGAIFAQAVQSACAAAAGGGIDTRTPRSDTFQISLHGLASLKPAHKTSALVVLPRLTTPALAPLALDHFSQDLVRRFTDAGFLLDPPPGRRNLRLHATLLNTIYGGARGQRGRGRDSARVKTFDARSLLEEWAQFTFAEGVVLDRVAVCRMSARPVTTAEGLPDEAYEVVASKGVQAGAGELD